jgi:hypothetical protein
MRFIPTTHMQSGNPCVASIANGGVSGSFTSASVTYNYHEFTSSDVGTTESYTFEITKGFTKQARVIVVGGGGSGGATTTFQGGAGGGGNVINETNVQLYPNYTYQIQVGKGGDAAFPGKSFPNATQNGANGDSSRFFVGTLINLTAQYGEGGNGNTTPTTNTNGGNSGGGFLGGDDNGLNYGGGGAGATQDGEDAGDGGTNTAGDGGNGVTLNLGYTSPSFGTSTISVGGGGGGALGSGVSTDPSRGFGADGGGNGNGPATRATDGTRYSGGGGGGGQVIYAADHEDDRGSIGGDGIVIVIYPTGSCY